MIERIRVCYVLRLTGENNNTRRRTCKRSQYWCQQNIFTSVILNIININGPLNFLPFLILANKMHLIEIIYYNIIISKNTAT